MTWVRVELEDTFLGSCLVVYPQRDKFEKGDSAQQYFIFKDVSPDDLVSINGARGAVVWWYRSTPSSDTHPDSLSHTTHVHNALPSFSRSLSWSVRTSLRKPLPCQRPFLRPRVRRKIQPMARRRPTTVDEASLPLSTGSVATLAASTSSAFTTSTTTNSATSTCSASLTAATSSARSASAISTPTLSRVYNGHHDVPDIKRLNKA
jgi:hypothetical protein